MELDGGRRSWTSTSTWSSRTTEPHGAPTVRHVAVTDSFLSRVPKLLLSREEMNVAELDHRDYFLVIAHGLHDDDREPPRHLRGMPSEEALALLEEPRTARNRELR